MNAFTVHDVFKITRFTDAPCISAGPTLSWLFFTLSEGCYHGDGLSSSHHRLLNLPQPRRTVQYRAGGASGGSLGRRLWVKQEKKRRTLSRVWFKALAISECSMNTLFWSLAAWLKKSTMIILVKEYTWLLFCSDNTVPVCVSAAVDIYC